MANKHAHRVGPLTGSSTDGAPLDLQTLAALIGAAWEGCAPCQARRVDEVLRGCVDVVAYFAGETWDGMRQQLTTLVGVPVPTGIPAETLHHFDSATSKVFRALNQSGRPGAEQVCRRMEESELRAVLEDCLDLFVGLAATDVVRV